MKFGCNKFLICLPLRPSLIGLCILDLLLMILISGYHVVPGLIEALEEEAAERKY